MTQTDISHQEKPKTRLTQILRFAFSVVFVYQSWASEGDPSYYQKQSTCGETIVLPAAEVDWHRTALHSDKPDDEVLRLTIGGGAKPNVLERWWNEHRMRWLDEGGTLLPGDTRGDLVSSVVQVDLNGDGVYDGDSDLTVKWCDSDGDGVPDVQAVALGPSGWDEKKHAYKNAGDWAVMIDHDHRDVFWWIDWVTCDIHHGFWARTGANAWLGNYHGNNTYTHANVHPSLLKDPGLAWENPFLFFDEDGDGCSEMSIRWGAPIRRAEKRYDIPPTLTIAHLSYDLDNNSGFGRESSYDLTLHGVGGALDITGMHRPLPQFAGNPVFDPCFHDNRWRRLTGLTFPTREDGYATFFATPWKSMYLTFDEDGDDRRWERVESYFPVDNKGQPVDIFSASPRSTEMGQAAVSGPSYHPQADSLGDRGEFDLDNSGGGKLYVGRFDHKLHLYGAEWGAWLVDKDAAFHGGAMGGQPNGPRANQVGEVVKYEDTDHDGFIDAISFSYSGNRAFDLTVSLKDAVQGENDPQKTEILDPRILGWQGMHKLYLRIAAEAWDQAMAIYRAAWKLDLTTPEIDRLASSSSLRQRHMNAWWITEGIARGLAKRMTTLAAEHPERAEAARKCHRDFITALYSGRTAEAVRILASTTQVARPAVTAQDLATAITGFQAYYAQGRFHYAAQVRELSLGVYGLATQAERLAHAKDLQAQMAADGTWPDIDYADQNITYWKVQQHANRAVLLAAAALSTNDAGDRAALVTTADRAITTWRERKFRNPGWWYNDFGAPQALGAAGLLLGDALSADNRAFLIKLTFRIGRKDQYDKIGGGGNQVWFLSRNLMGALLSRDPVWARTIADAIWMQVECPALVPPERRAHGVNAIEGVQPDASMHQHGAQMQFGNYGLSYAIDMAAWAVILRQSSLAMPADRVAAFRWYLLEGQDWVYWRGRIDPSCFGRRFAPRVSTAMYDMVRQPMADLAEIDPSAAGASRAFLARNQGDAANDRTGVRWFWRSDYGVFRNEGFFASVRLRSNHAIGYESCNGENLQGQRLGNGTTLLSTRGGEYDEIYPVWDWTRLPGITTTASATLLSQLTTAPSISAKTLPIAATPIQAGGVGDGRHGCFAYQHADKPTGMSARKAWFMDRDALVCLGAGIVGTGKGQPITSVNQCLGRGPVQMSTGGKVQELSEGTLRQIAAEWIEHDGLRYEFPNGGSLLAGTTTQTGAWPSVSTAVTSPLEPQSHQVFSLLIDHGRLPTAETYAYAVRPVGTAKATYRIVCNTPDLQAVAWDDRRCAVVFWQPGTVTWATGHTLQAAAPCLVYLDGDQVSVSDPTWKLTQIDLNIDGKLLSVNLRTDPGYAGSTITISNVPR